MVVVVVVCCMFGDGPAFCGGFVSLFFPLIDGPFIFCWGCVGDWILCCCVWHAMVLWCVVHGFSTESLILAQDERWRRA